ncbi:MAG: hypothetical protein AAF697_12535 [Pseudomonadota bacterium]
MYRFIGSLFLTLTALGGYTVSGGYLKVALINAVIFMILALGVVRLIEPRFGREGLVYGMGGAFMLSLLWPVAAMPWLVDEEECEGEECPSQVTFSIAPTSEAPTQ